MPDRSHAVSRSIAKSDARRWTGWRATRFRAALSMLGISWGIVSVVMLLAYGNGFHDAIAAGFRGAFGSGVAVIWPGQTSMQAGGERAGRRVRLQVDDVAGARDAAADPLGEPRVHRAPADRLRRSPGACTAIRGVNPIYGEMRDEKRRAGAGPLPRTIRTSRSAAASRSSGARSIASCSAGGRPSARRSASPGVRSRWSGVMEDKVQMSSYFSPDAFCVFIPYTTMGAARRRAVRRHAGVPERRPAAAAGGDPSGARRARQAPALQPGRRARAQHQRLGREHAGRSAASPPA